MSKENNHIREFICRKCYEKNHKKVNLKAKRTSLTRIMNLKAKRTSLVVFTKKCSKLIIKQ